MPSASDLHFSGQFLQEIFFKKLQHNVFLTNCHFGSIGKSGNFDFSDTYPVVAFHCLWNTSLSHKYHNLWRQPRVFLPPRRNDCWHSQHQHVRESEVNTQTSHFLPSGLPTISQQFSPSNEELLLLGALVWKLAFASRTWHTRKTVKAAKTTAICSFLRSLPPGVYLGPGQRILNWVSPSVSMMSSHTHMPGKPQFLMGRRPVKTSTSWAFPCLPLPFCFLEVQDDWQSRMVITNLHSAT